jgi:hypothetical protein
VRIVFVHGIAQAGKDSEELRLFWRGSLEEGFRNARLSSPEVDEVVFPYYGDELEERMKRIDAPLREGILGRGDAPVPDAEAIRAAMLAEIAQASGVTREEWEAELGAQPLGRAPQNWSGVLAILRLLDKTSVGTSLIDKVTRDVSVYLNYRSVRKAINGIVAEKLKDGPCVVVAHSLGSVVAYNTLYNTPRSVDVRLLITLGSPLGIRAVREKVEMPYAVPGCVREWHNVRDPKDTVALHPLDSTYFPLDRPITDDSTILNPTDNHHSIDGYLTQAAVAARIHKALQ